MKIIHSLVVTPGQCGLYETAKDLIVAERSLGHSVTVIEPEGGTKNMADPALVIARTTEDRAAVLLGADVLIDHSGTDAEMLASGVPIIHVRHGRPLATFLASMTGLDVYSHMARIGKDERYRAFVTFWESHVPYWEAVIGKPVHYVPACVDLDRFTPDGPKHDFGNKGGTINVVCADMWGRADECPFDVVHQFRYFAADNPGARLHVYGLKENINCVNTLLRTLGDNLGQCGWAKNMASVYRAADCLLTCSTTATRAVREAMACGCPVFTPGETPEATCRVSVRKNAEARYNPATSAKAMLGICGQVAGVPA